MAKLIRDPELDRLVEELNSDHQEVPLPSRRGEGEGRSLPEWPPAQVATGNPLEAMLIQMARPGASDPHVIACSPPGCRVRRPPSPRQAGPPARGQTLSDSTALLY